tara:strand:+ start:323 stop:703 length:381 start_codon:yes stop_codon:yes gene_type:complete
MNKEELTKEYNEDLKKENNRLKVGIKTEDLDSLKKDLIEQREKYFTLVSYARGVFPRISKEIEVMFPKEIKEFKSSPDFTHGFNSGCLASFRFVLSLIVEDPTGENKYDYLKNKLDELKEFPKLDT